MFNAENPRKYRLITILIMMVIVLILVMGSNNFGSDVRYFNDYYDRSKYAERGLWSITGQIPYVDIQSEYPQIPILLFGAITWLARLIIPSSWPLTVGFVFLWVVFIMVISILAMWQLWRMLPVGRKNLAWLMFLPSAIYFCLNRFDILPVYLGLLAVAALKKDRFIVAAVFLALGVFTKWYLVLIFPFFLAYEFNHMQKIPWRTALAFLAVSVAILLPTYIQGGWQAVWQPYSWHLNRMVEPGTSLWFLYQLFGHAGEEIIKPGVLAVIFTLMGFGGVLLVFFNRFDSIKKVILASILSL
ncbi:MAG: hypothetical protein JXR32_07355, partial [Anaerolineaceae bacterium]|nr:hypothetical protein [Anaerolineaceae bacterium]